MTVLTIKEDVKNPEQLALFDAEKDWINDSEDFDTDELPF